MKNKPFLLVMLVCILALSFGFVSCGGDDDNGGGGKNTTKVVEEQYRGEFRAYAGQGYHYQIVITENTVTEDERQDGTNESVRNGGPSTYPAWTVGTELWIKNSSGNEQVFFTFMNNDSFTYRGIVYTRYTP